MRVLNVFAAGAGRASMLLTAALRRSFTSGLVRGPLHPDSGAEGPFSVFADCRNCPPEVVCAAVRRGGKLLLTGTPGTGVMPVLGLKSAPDMIVPPEAAHAEQCFSEPFHESAGRISYTGHPSAVTSPVRDRAFNRYDYAEWNNLGFGAVRAGGDFGVCGGVDSVMLDVRRSIAWFQQNLSEIPPPKLAVSPFHSNPVHAVQALEEAGIEGFVGGIIDYDPEFLLGRAGQAPFARKILSVSQQSMLHGDSYRNQGQSVAVHVRAFAAQHRARGIFGYLDHPFSERYQYGWESEEQRTTAHQRLLSAIKAHSGVLFLNQEQCFAFVGALAGARLEMTDSGRVHAPCAPRMKFALQYRLEGEEWDLRRRQ
jgi:hypothetical protein